MTFGASARAVEISNPRFGIPRLEISDVHRTPTPLLRFRFSIMNKRDNRGELFVSGRKRRHSLVQPPISHDGADLFSMYVLRDQCRRGQVRTAFATCSVTSVAEAALPGEESLTGLYLFRRIRG